MISFWVTLIYFPSLLLGKFIFQRWFNPIFLYASSWAFIIYMYDLKLIGYVPITSLTWLVVLLAYASFLTGIFIVYVARGINNDTSIMKQKNNRISEKWWDNKEQLLKKIVLVTAIIGLLVSLQHWYVLIKKFGSIMMVFLHASDIYDMRVGGEHLGKIPYFNLLSFVSVFFSAIYSAYKNKFSFIVILPFIAVILADAASLARAGVFFALVLFGISFITARYYFKNAYNNPKYKNNRNIIVTSVIVILLAMVSVSLIRLVRNPMGDFKSTSIELKKLSNNGLMSSSLYLYFSSPVAVLSQYLDQRNEDAIFGENTFYPIYNNLNRFGGNFQLEPYPKGYFIPMWVNSATYLRDADVDFGAFGIFIIPFVIGFFSTFYWFRYFETGKLIDLTFYTFITILTVFSVFYIGTRLTFWLFGLLFSILTVIYFDRANIKLESPISEDI